MNLNSVPMAEFIACMTTRNHKAWFPITSVLTYLCSSYFETLNVIFNLCLRKFYFKLTIELHEIFSFISVHSLMHFFSPFRNHFQGTDSHRLGHSPSPNCPFLALCTMYHFPCLNHFCLEDGNVVVLLQSPGMKVIGLDVLKDAAKKIDMILI
jgi:hypothetical protein